jgi:RNA polymerase sigma-70 factor (ECF subfamily)
LPAAGRGALRTPVAGRLTAWDNPLISDPRRGEHISETSFSLLDRLRLRPDAAAWEKFVRLYEPLLGGWLRRAGVRPPDADDLVQEVLGVVVRELPAFQHNQRPGAFRTWLRNILTNRMRAFWKARRAQPVATGGRTAGGGLEQLEDPEGGLSRLWDEEHDRHVLRRLLELVEPDFAPATWEAFRRVTLEGQPAAVVARELSLSVNAVWLAKSRVLRRLRQESRDLLDPEAFT